MNATTRNLLIVLGLAAFGALCTWIWYEAMEQKWEVTSAQSDAARRNRLLAATMLLRADGHKVAVAGSLGEVSLAQLPDGMLLLADASGVMETERAARLQAWVARGNTLVLRPRYLSDNEFEELNDEILKIDEADGTQSATPKDSVEDSKGDDASDDEDEADKGAAGPDDSTDELVETDPIAARLGVRLMSLPVAPSCKVAAKGKRCTPAAAGHKSARLLRHVQIPGSAHPLNLDAGREKLISMPKAEAPLWSDNDANTVRVYQHGKGRIVMLAADFFNNDALREADHGELLLALGALNPASKHVTIVQNLDAPPWYLLLWMNFKLALIALAVLLALILWSALRRFGPLLPQPVTERRSLMEHIDASGAWLWKARGGPDVLLGAAREDTLALLRRRAPRLMRLPEQALCAALARQCSLPADQIGQALFQAAAPTPLHFTRQIRILQELRNHHDR